MQCTCRRRVDAMKSNRVWCGNSAARWAGGSKKEDVCVCVSLWFEWVSEDVWVLPAQTQKFFCSSPTETLQHSAGRGESLAPQCPLTWGYLRHRHTEKYLSYKSHTWPGQSKQTFLGRHLYRCQGDGRQDGSTSIPPAAGALCTAADGRETPLALCSTHTDTHIRYNVYRLQTQMHDCPRAVRILSPSPSCCWAPVTPLASCCPTYAPHKTGLSESRWTLKKQQQKKKDLTRNSERIHIFEFYTLNKKLQARYYRFKFMNDTAGMVPLMKHSTILGFNGTKTLTHTCISSCLDYLLQLLIILLSVLYIVDVITFIGPF